MSHVSLVVASGQLRLAPLPSSAPPLPAVDWRQDEQPRHVGNPTRVIPVSIHGETLMQLSDQVGTWAGDIDKAHLPAHFLVDHVRVYDSVPGESP